MSTTNESDRTELTTAAIDALRALVNRDEFHAIVRLKERVQAQKIEIDNLHRIINNRMRRTERSARNADIQNARMETTLVGDVLADGWGEEFTVDRVARSGWVDTNGNKHYWHEDFQRKTVSPQDGEEPKL